MSLSKLLNFTPNKKGKPSENSGGSLVAESIELSNLNLNEFVKDFLRMVNFIEQ